MTRYNTSLAKPTGCKSQIVLRLTQKCTIKHYKGSNSRVTAPYLVRMYTGAEVDWGAARAKLRMRSPRAGLKYSHLHGSFRSEITLQDILQSPSRADVHGKGRLSPRHFSFRVKCLYSSHCIAPRPSGRGPESGSTARIRPVTEASGEKERELTASRASRKL